MISLRPIEYADADVLDGSEYGSMSLEERLEMIAASLDKSRRGYAYEAECMVLEMMKQKGYTIATGSVLATNTASHALHKKLGFEIDRTYINERGHEVYIYVKAL